MTTCNSGTYITDNDQYIKKIGANKLYVLALKDFVQHIKIKIQSKLILTKTPSDIFMWQLDLKDVNISINIRGIVKEPPLKK